MIAAALRRALARAPALAAPVKSRPVQHAIQTVRGAKAVREPLRFVALQLAPARVAAHRLRDSDMTVFVRHRTRDVHILNEIFGGTGGRRSYQPPPELAAELDARRAPKVIDLGANIGLFGAYALGRWPDAAVRSFEPDPANLRMLTRVIAANGLEHRWSVADVAVADRAGAMSFTAGLFADSHLELASDAGVPRGRMITVRTVDLFEQDHDVDLIKIDIEGGEWAILSDPRLASLQAAVIVLEWHARGCPETDVRACVLRLLRAAGYERIDEVERGPDNGLLWARRAQAAPEQAASVQSASVQSASVQAAPAQAASGARRSGDARDRQSVAAEHTGAVTERRDPALGAHA
jgi:FkbM family methyltransferase